MFVAYEGASVIATDSVVQTPHLVIPLLEMGLSIQRVGKKTPQQN